MCKLVHSRRSTTPAEQAEPSRWSPINTAKTRGKRRARACARVPCRASNGDADPARAAPNSDGPSEPTTLPPALSSRPTARLTRAPNTATPTRTPWIVPAPRPRHSPPVPPSGSAQHPHGSHAIGRRCARLAAWITWTPDGAWFGAEPGRALGPGDDGATCWCWPTGRWLLVKRWSHLTDVSCTKHETSPTAPHHCAACSRISFAHFISACVVRATVTRWRRLRRDVSTVTVTVTRPFQPGSESEIPLGRRGYSY
jgi:hypothetical protein